VGEPSRLEEARRPQPRVNAYRFAVGPGFAHAGIMAATAVTMTAMVGARSELKWLLPPPLLAGEGWGGVKPLQRSRQLRGNCLTPSQPPPASRGRGKSPQHAGESGERRISRGGRG
jgi:hypothetical protein